MQVGLRVNPGPITATDQALRVTPLGGGRGACKSLPHPKWLPDDVARVAVVWSRVGRPYLGRVECSF